MVELAEVSVEDLLQKTVTLLVPGGAVPEEPRTTIDLL